MISHSPVWSPARTSIPSGLISSAIAQEQRTPRAGPSKVARMPSPVVLISWPRKRARLPLPGGGHVRYQPVFAGDVAEAIAKAVDGEAKAGTVYELGGPDVRTFKELMEFMLATVERR